MTPISIIYILGAIIFGASSKILSRYSAETTNVLGLAIFIQFTAALIFLPSAIIHFSFPSNTTPLLALTLASIVWAIIAVTSLNSHKHTPVSLREPISQLRAIVVFLLGILLLGESWSGKAFFGTVLIALGITIAIFHPERKFGNFKNRGVQLTILSSTIAAIAPIMDKFSLGFFDPNVYGFLVYFIPGLILLSIPQPRRENFKEVFKNKFWPAVGISVSSAISYFCILKTYLLLPVTIAYPILQTSSLVVVISGIVLLKEKNNLFFKIAGTIVTILGVILLKQ
ncbi:MAG: hypothetical protein EXS46_00180 [Candidatus Taylorbacteria bacterium]|nr:hypothetical protein [Candidatus Taylorbacteria bacterium]